MSRPPVSRLLYPGDPYEGFDHQAYPMDIQGWGEENPIFQHLMVTNRPRTIIEVGTWKGRSAITMALIMRNLGIEGEVVCVDTFLGSVEQWTDPDCYKSLNHRHGYPTLYYQFLANVCHTGMQNYITPFPISSDAAAQYLTQKNIQADLVYVDAGHSYREALNDIQQYWPLVRPGGVLLGDDFVAPEVLRAVADFANANAVTVQCYKEKYFFTKG
ncbi:class I SAM-dependent methyltransferase [Niveispirillum sp. KHB5.9]|uniref:class I SAM-dependent methyltransferase n=1 Tax=Niveispirillum sp. KHB5.9 TaxID=3400269 RepID=UPI003A89EE62